MGSIIHSVTMLGCLIKMIGIDPGNRGGHHAKVEMIGHRMRIPGLAFRATDFLLNFLET
jgi:hypothetical protein